MDDQILNDKSPGGKSVISKSSIADQQKQLYNKNQNIIDNFAKFEDDLFKFEEELSSMINPTVEQDIFTSGLSASNS